MLEWLQVSIKGIQKSSIVPLSNCLGQLPLRMAKCRQTPAGLEVQIIRYSDSA